MPQHAVRRTLSLLLHVHQYHFLQCVLVMMFWTVKVKTNTMALIHNNIYNQTFFVSYSFSKSSKSFWLQWKHSSEGEGTESKRRVKKWRQIKLYLSLNSLFRNPSCVHSFPRRLILTPSCSLSLIILSLSPQTAILWTLAGRKLSFQHSLLHPWATYTPSHLQLDLYRSVSYKHSDIKTLCSVWLL